MADDLQQITNLVAQNTNDQNAIGAQLNTLNENVQGMTRNMEEMIRLMGGRVSTSQANYRTFRQQYNDVWGTQNRGYGGDGTIRNANDLRNINGNAFRFNQRDFRRVQNSFLDGFEDALLDGFVGSGFRERVNAIFQGFAEQLGGDIQDIPGNLGNVLGRHAMNAFRNTPFGDSITNAMQSFVPRASTIIQERGTNFLAELTSETGTLQSAFETLGGTVSIGDELILAGGEAIQTVIAFAPEIAAAAAIVVVAFHAIDTVLESFELTVQAVQTAVRGMSQAANRETTSRQQNVQLAKTRMEEDYKVLVEQPFKLLEQAASSLYDSWNQNLTTITATQGYDKADVQDLMAAFAERLRDEGLANYISGTDLVSNLTKVIQSGMSGVIAEEFAYQATVLGKAIPTQDFFSYASTYASIASNAARAGKSQQEAIEEANASLQSFANGLLYAQRELTGGFTTGLRNGSVLYEQAAKIAQAAKSDNLTNITGALLSIQSYVGAIAPDLADQLTGSVYKALTGGNSADIVALRSLANVNASNTEFLRAFAQNPQAIFATMFENLANMYSESSDAYMEKAEGYAQLFGLSSEAFQRIDFADLASAIRDMNMSSGSLDENMKLLREGQTTTNAEQLKAQQINQIMIEEGLAYVIDNEAAQLIQQHMWDEQLAREIMESQYSVALTGAAMEALEMIQHAVQNILNFLNPLAYAKKLGNLVATTVEAGAQEADVRQLLELGKVGNGNARQLYQLTTRGQDLNVTRSLVELMGGNSLYEAASNATQMYNQLTSPLYTLSDNVMRGVGVNTALMQMAIGNRNNTDNERSNLSVGSGIASQYGWGAVSKSRASIANAFLSIAGTTTAQTPDLSTVTTAAGTTAASASASAVKQSIDKMLEDSYLVDQFVKKGKGYEDWAATASKYGIADISAALQEAGYSESDVMQYFQDKEVQEGVTEQQAIREEEKTFRDRGINFWDTYFPNEYKEPLFIKAEEIKANQATMISNQETMITNQTTMITNQATMITNQGTMITNQEVMIEKLGLIIENQTSWHNYFKDTWAVDWNTYFRDTTIQEGWDKYFKQGWSDGKWGDFLKIGGQGATFGNLYDEFVKYFVKHEYYSNQASTTDAYKYSDVEAIQREKEAADRGDAVTALAEMLTKNLVDLSDPTRQTNGLLAQILLVVQAIKNQIDSADNEAGTEGNSLGNSLMEMILGLTGKSTSNTTDTNSNPT